MRTKAYRTAGDEPTTASGRRRRSRLLVALVGAALVASSLAGCRLARTMDEYDAAAPGERVVALTFDDGPGPSTLPMLDVLDRHGVKATFFVTGVQASRHPYLVDEIVRRGHRVGNHTWNHVDLRKVSPARFDIEVDYLTVWLNRRGIDPKCMRPPYGSYDRSVVDRMRNRNATYTAFWSIDPRDWQNPNASRIANHVTSNLHPGAVVVMHDGPGNRSATVAAVDQMIPRIRAAGYAIRPVC